MSNNGGRGPIFTAGGRASNTNETKSSEQQDSRVLRNEKFGDILHEYLFLELGKSKKEVYNLMSLTQSMKIYSKMRDTNHSVQLLHTALQFKAINTRLEIKLQLACMDIDKSQIEVEDQKKKVKSLMSVGPLTLQSTQLEDSDFKNQFFLSRSSFQMALTSLKAYVGNRTTIDVEKQLMVTLSYLGTAYSYEEISSKFNISISTTQRYINYVANRFFKHTASVIFWPSNQQANLEIQGFNEMPGNKFPGILGVIGTVELNKSTTANPNPSQPTDYNSSIVIQGVCNSKYQFYNIFTCFLLNSSVTTETFHESSLAKIIMNHPDILFPNKTTHLVGSCCYPLLPNLMTPFPEGPYNTAPQNNYNGAIVTPLNIIKLAFGKLFGRFKRLTCLDCQGEEKFAALIFTACYLHNLCQKNNDIIYCEPYKCCTFKCNAVDTISLRKRQEICNNLTSESDLRLNSII